MYYEEQSGCPFAIVCVCVCVCERLTGREGDVQAAAEVAGSLYKQFGSVEI